MALSLLCPKPKDVIHYEQNRGLIIKFHAGVAVLYIVGGTRRRVRTRKREHVDAVKTFNAQMFALNQHFMSFDHRIN